MLLMPERTTSGCASEALAEATTAATATIDRAERTLFFITSTPFLNPTRLLIDDLGPSMMPGQCRPERPQNPTDTSHDAP
jgi:hypothetical protein